MNNRNNFSYDEAVAYIEDAGISCDPCDLEGDYVCNMLDMECDGYDEWDEPCYTEETLKTIIDNAKQYIEDMKE